MPKAHYFTCPVFPCAYWSEEDHHVCPDHDKEMMIVATPPPEAREEHEQAGPQFKLPREN